MWTSNLQQFNQIKETKTLSKTTNQNHENSRRKLETTEVKEKEREKTQNWK